LKRLLRLVLVTTIVAAFHAQAAAAVVVSEDVPIAGGATALAEAVGLDAPPDRARFVAEIVRHLYNIADGRRTLPERLARLLQSAQAEAIAQTGQADGDGADRQASADLVPVPLTAAIWSDAVFHRRVPPADLVPAILVDRQAALLCYGLSALDDQTLAFLVGHPAVITRLYTESAGAFGVFAGGLHIRDGRVLTPGGEAATPLWEAAAGEEVTRPDRFVRELFVRGEGRLAYLYDAIAQLDAPHAAFALGLWMPAGPVRAERFRQLVSVNDGAYREWHLSNVPFARPIYDIASLLTRVQVEADGSPAPPSGRAMWTAAFDGGETAEGNAAIPPRASDASVDAAWLAQAIASMDAQQRGDRLDQFSFGQRAFARAADDDRAAVLTALRGFARARMLMLTLDRIGITAPRVYEAAARHATRLAQVDRGRGFVALAQYQGALALIARMVRVRSIEPAAAQELIASLSAVPVAGDGYRGSLLRWIDHDLRPLASGADDLESGIIAKLAGTRAVPASSAIRTVWEGQSYRLDLAGAEERRIRLVREKQHGPSLDLAIDIERDARNLSADPIAADALASGIAALERADGLLPPRDKGTDQPRPDGVAASRDPHDTLETVVAELVKAKKASSRRVAHIVDPLTPAAEALAADALLSLAYAVDLGDPDGTALLAGNVARRHDFGFGTNDAAARARLSWSWPKQDVMPGSPWHVMGSALGLDVALASLALRRLDASHVTGAPSLTSNERQTFAVSVAIMNPTALTDADRDTIAAAIERGRARISAATPDSFDAIADEIALDGWRRRAVRWALIHDSERVATMFSLTEMLSLGRGPSPAGLDAWGMAATVTTGCVCTRLSAPGGWWNLSGRPQLGLFATTIADLNLHVAVLLHELGLPGAIARHVLTAAVQDYIDEVRPADNDDWLALVRAAQAVPRERIEDYIAAITAGGPLVPDSAGREDMR
jgi:hypothetical protein